MEGQILGNRYELIEKIGGGGMAHVYKAKCRLLNRFVAVKILRSEFTNDDEFVKRFRIEAQSAASLSHPNIVSIYDVGHEDDIHYIIMEYIDGITLKEYISSKGVLDWKEAVNITIQICSAIDHAHRNRIIHRDIKPHNILLTNDGIAKVTDFGIARAVSSSTITMVGSTIGSVHYFSPEQARGGFTDEKSDLYSLGISLYEMVTGRVPFDGETPVAVALKHIQIEAEQPIDVDNNIPSGVNSIIVKAIKKEQNKRYQTASDMLSDLYKVLRDPNSILVADDSSVDSQTKRIPAIRYEKTPQKEAPVTINKDKNEKVKKKGDNVTVLLAIATSLILIALFTYMGFRLVVPYVKDTSQDFVIQNYVGKNINEVTAELSKEGITPNVKRKSNETVAKDLVVSQNWEPNKTFKKGGLNTLEFEVSDGAKVVKIVDLKKEDYRTAESTLQDAGLSPRVEEEFSETIAVGHVIRTDPDAGEEVKPGSVVTVFKSKGPELKSTKVPDLIGKTMVEAQQLLTNSKLSIGKMYPEDRSSVVDKITKQDPAALTEVSEGTAVNVYFGDEGALRKKVTERLDLYNAQAFGDKIAVRIEITPSDTNKAELLMNETKSKNEFPLTLQVPVPDKGKTTVTVFFDDKLIKVFVKDGG